MSAGDDWTHRPEGGGRFAIWLIRGIAQYGGRAVSRLLLFPITLYFLIVRGPERRASRDYLGRVFGRPATTWQVCRHIHCFASTILDRVFMLSGRFRSLDVRVHGVDALHEVMEQGRGALLFGSHHGSFEILRVFSQERPDARVRVVMDPGQNRAITELLDALCPEIAATVIDARMDGASIALAIQREADLGALISLPKAGFGKNCLLARRLIERGVRFVQLFNGAYAMGEGVGNWDGHKTIEKQYSVHGPILDQPVAGLLKDLKARGLLQDTLVAFVTEFGRMPTFQKGANGRDHNPKGFTVWLAGAGVKKAYSYGATDEFGYQAAERVSSIYDLHATILHLVGIDHERLSYYNNGIERRLTDVHGHVIRDVLA